MKMKLLAAAGVVALATVGTAAQARDNVYWSLGVSSPGVALGVGNVGVAAPVYVAPAPVYVAPPPPVVYAPRPVVLVPAPVYYGAPRYPSPYGGAGSYGYGGGSYLDPGGNIIPY